MIYKTQFAKYGDHPAIEEYKKVSHNMIKLLFPLLTDFEIDNALDYSISNRITDHPAVLDNNYKHQQVETTLLEMCDYIMSREPIITSYGVLFKKHGEVPNPIGKMLDGFLINRKRTKKEMFKYPKGSEMYEKLNLSQSLLKIDANGLTIINKALYRVIYICKFRELLGNL